MMKLQLYHTISVIVLRTSSFNNVYSYQPDTSHLPIQQVSLIQVIFNSISSGTGFLAPLGHTYTAGHNTASKTLYSYYQRFFLGLLQFQEPNATISPDLYKLLMNCKVRYTKNFSILNISECPHRFPEGV